MKFLRRESKVVFVGNVPIGNPHPVIIQSMTNTRTYDGEKTLKQIKELANEGCELIRVGITSEKDLESIPFLVNNSPIPIIGDIQYDYRHGIKAVESGIHGIRINPGYVADKEKLNAIATACKAKGVSIRVGVNSGSINPHWEKVYGGVNEKSLAHSALDQVKSLEECDFNNIKVAIKASDPMTMIKANRLFSELTEYPLHLGVTESGTSTMGIVKSSIGIGALLADGIGDTIRVSLTEDPIEEIRAAKRILQALGLRKFGINIISCPTCSRTNIDLIELVKKAEKMLENIDKDITVAIMGCPVNGPGEAKEADIGISGGISEGTIFKRGKIIKRVPENELLSTLMEEINYL
ncbi:MAG: flavodoxin-dependent (E)-4-hydroxy-3-methylbut-2-enyl-diphosphate synthase [Tissierellia bacterium]|nr:flavodoxin-dependent (E)-4-hydroxy-3-methylbut-2-enyl-diphosphate synthase [Tissierellia bacterium]